MRQDHQFALRDSLNDEKDARHVTLTLQFPKHVAQ